MNIPVWDIYTYGNGDVLAHVFNGVAIIFNHKDFASMASFAGLGGFIFVFSTIIFSKKYENIMKSFIMFAVAYSVLFGIKTSVSIVDKIDNTRIATRVDNIPLALAFWGSITSRGGYVVTHLMDQAFALPGDTQYTKTGMLFGAKIMLESRSVGIGNPYVKYSIGQYTKQCLYPALVHNYLSIQDLMSSTHILDELKAAAKPGWFTRYKDTKGVASIETCSKAYSNISSMLSNPTKTGSSTFDKILDKFTGSSNNATVAKNAIMSSIPNAYSFFLSNSDSAVQILQNDMLMDPILNTGKAWSREAGNSASSTAFLSARANRQTLNTYNATGLQAAEWVPILRNVFEALFYGAFPIVCLLMLTPIAGKVLMGYAGSYIWLQSFAPLYAILNLIMTIKLQHNLIGFAPNIADSAGMDKVLIETQAQAGMLSMSIPFIAPMIFGLGKVSGAAHSLLAPAQSAAAQAATEQTTGSHSYGNVSLGNISSNNMSQNKVDISSAFSGPGHSSVKNYDGNTTSSNADGSFTSQTQISHYKNKMNIGESIQKNASDMVNQSFSKIDSAQKSIGNNYIHSDSKSMNDQYGNTQSRTDDVSKTQDATQAVNDSHSTGAKSLMSLVASGKVNVSVGGKFFGSGVTATAEGGVSVNGSVFSSEDASIVKGAIDATHSREAISRVGNFSRTHSSTSTESGSHTDSDTISSNVSQAMTAQNVLNYSQSNSESFNRDATMDVQDVLSNKYHDKQKIEDIMNGDPNSAELTSAKQEAFAKIERNYSDMHSNHTAESQNITNSNATGQHHSLSSHLYNNATASQRQDSYNNASNEIQSTLNNDHSTTMKVKGVAQESATQRAEEKLGDSVDKFKKIMPNGLKNHKGNEGTPYNSGYSSLGYGSTSSYPANERK